jgi:ribosomal protein L19E
VNANVCEHHHRGYGAWRGFRRHGVPSREEWVERLEAYRERLEGELANIEELLKRLKDAPTETATL